MRTGVSTGEVVAGAGETLVTGDAVNVAARLEQSAQRGEILLGDATLRLVREVALVEPVEELALKGKTQSVSAWRLLRILPDIPGFARPLATPFIGREQELAALEAAFERTAAERCCELVTVLGEPGIGKSRLLREFAAAAGGRARVLVGCCLPYGEGITYWPLVDIIREVAGGEPRAVVSALLANDENAELVAELVAATVGASEGTDRRTRSTGRYASCSKRLPANGNSSSSSRTCTGPRRPFSTSLNTSLDPAPAGQFCWSPVHGPSCSRRVPHGPPQG